MLQEIRSLTFFGDIHRLFGYLSSTSSNRQKASKPPKATINAAKIDSRKVILETIFEDTENTHSRVNLSF